MPGAEKGRKDEAVLLEMPTSRRTLTVALLVHMAVSETTTPCFKFITCLNPLHLWQTQIKSEKILF